MKRRLVLAGPVMMVVGLCLQCLAFQPLPAGKSPGDDLREPLQEKKLPPQDWDAFDHEQDRRWNIDGLLDRLDIRPGQMIGDLGAGWGYLTIKLARRVSPGGRVYAEDINTRFLKALEARVLERGLSNVEIIRGGEYEPGFPAGGLDMIVMRAVIQFIDDRPRFLRAACDGLKDDGRFVLIEGESAESSSDDGVIGSGRLPTRKGFLEIFRRAGLVLVSAETIEDREPSRVGAAEMTVFVLRRAPKP